MKRIVIVLIIFYSFLGYAQQSREYQPNPKYPELFKTIPLISEESPNWVKLMYSENPNFFAIEKAYTHYYKEHIFSKTTHTQNFKHLSYLLNTLNCVKEDGSIILPNLQEKKLQEQFIKNKIQNVSRVVETANWTSIGPSETFDSEGATYKASQLNVYTFEQAQSNPNILYAGGETGGLFKSTDKGLNWLPIAEDINLQAKGAIAIDSANENIVFVSDGGDRLWKTTDGGVSWTIVHEVNQLRITDIAINGVTILTAGNKGLFRSTDSGATWVNILSDKCWDIELKTDDVNTVFVAKSNPSLNRTEIWKSIDNAVTFNPKTTNWWNPIGGLAASNGGARIAVTNADPNRIYVVLLGSENDANDDANFIGIFRSDDVGESWSMPYDGNNDGFPDNEPGGPYSDNHWCMSTFNPSSNGGYDQGYYNLGLAVSDTDPDKFLVGFLNLFKSENGGISYTKWGGYVCDNCGTGYRHPDIQEIEINGNDVWVCSDGGVDYYDANLDYQETRIKGLSGTNFWEVDQGWNEDVIVGGRYHNGNTAYYQSYGKGKFLSLGGGESATGYVDKGNNRKTHFSDITDKELPESLTGGVTNIANYQLYPNQHYYMSSKSEIVTHPYYWNTLYLGKDHKLWKSTDGGVSFDLLNEFGTNTDNLVKGIEISRNNPDIIYVIQRENSQDILWKSIDAGSSWENISIPSSSNHSFISVDEEDANTLFLSFSNGGTDTNKIFKTTNGGATWTNLTTTTLDNESIKYIKTQAGTDGGIYIATDYNLYYRNNSHTDWQLFVDGLPFKRDPLKLMPFYKDAKLRYATFNRGVYESDFYEVSAPIAQPMIASRLQNCSTRGVQFEDFSILNHEGASWQWDFPGATSVSSTTVRNPLVIYDTQGQYDVTLTVTDANGLSSSKTVTNMVEVGENYCAPEPDPQMALECNETYQYAENNTIDYDNVSGFTFTAWVKPNGIQNDYSALFSLGSGDGDNKNVLNFREGNNTLGIHWNGGYWSWDSNIIVPENQWSYVAITVSPTEIKLFVNEESITWNINSNSIDITRIIVGSYYGWGSRNYKGLIDEASFWKRTLSEDEIRLSRHLSKQDMSDPDMIAYYQFNHKSNGKVYDKKNTHDLSLSNNAGIVDSTAPFGIGTSQIMDITTSGVKDFATANTAIDFANGTLPDGKVVVSKINLAPNNIPSTYTIDDTYFVINNYGINQNFTPLNEITFSQVGDLSGVTTADIRLYKRMSNSDVQTDWIENTTAVSSDNTTESVTFSGENIISFGQFYIGSATALGTDEAEIGKSFILYPNPVISGNTLYFNTDDVIVSFVLYDNLGKEVFKSNNTESSITINSLSKGMYIYRVETTNKMYSGKLMVH